MKLPDDFLPPELPEGYSVKYEGDSGSFPGQRLYRLHKGFETPGLFYDNHVFWHEEKGIEDVLRFPSREAMYNWIVAQCVLDTWEET